MDAEQRKKILALRFEEVTEVFNSLCLAAKEWGPAGGRPPPGF
jgi:hypothetical protein